MEQNFQTSFIPKKPIIKERAQFTQPVGIFFVASVFILFTMLVATAGLYFYKASLNRKIASMQNTLNLAKNRFEADKITELQVLDKRLSSSTEILSKHIAVSPVFKALEDITLKTVRYTDFSYSLDSDKGQKVLISMSGTAVGYKSVALQSDLFLKNKNIIDPIFSNLTLDTSGNVNFDLEFLVDPSFVDYKQVLLTQTE